MITELNDNRAAQGLVFNSTGTVEIRARTTGITSHALTLEADGITVNESA